MRTFSANVRKNLDTTEKTGHTHARLCHIMNLLLLAPEIQRDILTLPDVQIAGIAENKVRAIVGEIDWGRQIKTWKDIKSHA